MEYLRAAFRNSCTTVGAHPDDPAYVTVSKVLSLDGSKFIQAYVRWRETGDALFSYPAHDLVAIGVNDLACANAVPERVVSGVLLDPRMAKEELLEGLAAGFARAGTRAGVACELSIGEIEGLDQSVVATSAVYGRVKPPEAITGKAIQPGDAIIGLRSDGRAPGEEKRNSGIMVGNVRLALHCLMHPAYAEKEKYPEIGGKGAYYGRFKVGDYDMHLGMTVDEALLSPTRLFAPAVREIVRAHGKDVHGLVHNASGGQTAILRTGSGIHYVKRLGSALPIFTLIRHESELSWRDMYRFNMGFGVDVIAAAGAAREVVDTANRFGADALVVGRCEARAADRPANRWGNQLTIESVYGEGLFTYP